MITTTYTCDCCGRAELTPNNMKFIAINYNSTDYGHGQNFHQKLWCVDFCDKFKLKKIDPATPPPVIITLEDTVREIIREEINAKG